MPGVVEIDEAQQYLPHLLAVLYLPYLGATERTGLGGRDAGLRGAVVEDLTTYEVAQLGLKNPSG